MMMRRRLYFLLPDNETARAILNEMLLARIEVGRMCFLGKRGQLPPDLPEANFLHKTDFVHGAQLGLGVGGLCGIVVGLLVVAFPPGGASVQLVTVLIAAVMGALFGAWASSMVASAVPNSKLKRFHAEIERGRC